MDEEISYPHTPAGLLAQQLRALQSSFAKNESAESTPLSTRKELARSTLQSIYKLLTAYPEKFSSGSSAVLQQLEELQQVLLQQMQQFENNLDLMKGLVTLSNLVQRLQSLRGSGTQQATSSTSGTHADDSHAQLALLARFFVKVQDDEEALFQTLALIAHVGARSGNYLVAGFVRPQGCYQNAQKQSPSLHSYSTPVPISSSSCENSEHDEQQTAASHSNVAKLNTIEEEAASDLSSGLMTNLSASNPLGQKNDSGISSAGAGTMMAGAACSTGSTELGSTNKSSNGNRKPWFTKQFVQKFIEFEIDSVQVPGSAQLQGGAQPAKHNGILPLFAAVAVILATQRSALLEMRVLNQFKSFLLQLLRETHQQDAKALGQVVYSLSRIVQDAKLNEKEVLKMRTIEILIPLIARERTRVVIFGAVRILKTLWRANIRRVAMMKQDIVKRLIEVYGLQPQFVQGFADEILAAPEGLTLLREQGQLMALVRHTIVQNSVLEAQSKQAFAYFEKCDTRATVQQIIASIGQGLVAYLQAQLQGTSSENSVQPTADSTPLSSAVTATSQQQKPNNEFHLQQAVQDYFSFLLRASAQSQPKPTMLPPQTHHLSHNTANSQQEQLSQQPAPAVWFAQQPQQPSSSNSKLFCGGLFNSNAPFSIKSDAAKFSLCQPLVKRI